LAADHDVHADRPDAAAAAIQEWLAQDPATGEAQELALSSAD
jgi:hypothetical protein